MIKLFHQCPACGGQVIITECRCSECKLEMRGEFQLNSFSQLSEDQLTFIRVFLAARGNLTETEKILGISYPTIRNKLDEINNALEKTDGKKLEGVTTTEPIFEDQRQAILRKVAKGKLSAFEALRMLQNQPGAKS
jgi:hypothetical protein